MALVALAGAGCAAGGGRAPSSAPAAPSAAGTDSRWLAAPPPEPPRRSVQTVVIEEPARPTEDATLAGGGSAPIGRAGRGARGRRGVRDVHLRDASVQDAMRLLADVGGFALVVDSELEGSVSLDLGAVDPLAALVAIAETKGALVEVQGGVVVVKKK